MGTYIAQSDIENVFGDDNVAVWSNLEGGDAVNVTRVAAAITYAEGIVDDTFRDGRYTIPFSPIPVIVTDWCAKLAGIWLFMCRPQYKKDREASEGFMDVREAVFEEMNAYLAGRRVFSCDKSTTKDVNSPTVV